MEGETYLEVKGRKREVLARETQQRKGREVKNRTL
jgi:hypothetical protein